MAAHSDDAQRKIEIAIIKSTIGRGNFSRLPLFDNQAEEVILFITKQVATQNEKEEFILNQSFIQKIAAETGQNSQKVEKVLSDLLNSKRIEYIFELTAEVRLEKISVEEKSEIEHLQSFFNFLMDFILFYPYSGRVQKNKINIGKIDREIAQAFTQIYFDLIRFQEKVEQKIALKEAEPEQEEMPGEKPEGLLKEELEKIREERLEKKQKEQEERLVKEKEWLYQLSIQEFSKLFPEFEKWFSTTISKSLSEKNIDFSEKTALKRQLIAVQGILNRLAEKMAEKEAALKAREEEEAALKAREEEEAALKAQQKEETEISTGAETLSQEEILSIQREIASMDAEQLEDMFYTRYKGEGLTEKKAREKARIAAASFEIKKTTNDTNKNMDLYSAPPPPPQQQPTITARQAALFKAAQRQASGSQPKGQGHVDLDELKKFVETRQLKSIIIAQDGGHDYSKAESEAKVAESLPQSSVPQKKLLLDKYEKKLLKDGENWPEGADMTANTFYFKWDNENKKLMGKCKKEDGTVFNCERLYKLDATIKALSEAFEHSKLTVKVIDVLNHFANQAQASHDGPPATSSEKKEGEEVAKGVMPVLAKSLSLQSGSSSRSSFYAPQKLRQSSAMESGVSILSPDSKKGVEKVGEEEKAKEEVKAEIASEDRLDKKANLLPLPSSPSCFYSNAPLPPVPVIKASDKPDSERTSPRLQ